MNIAMPPVPPLKLFQSNSTLRCILILLAVTFACFAPVLFHDFVNYDDPTYLHQNTIIQQFSLPQIARIFQAMLEGHYNRFNPLVYVVTMTVHHLAGFDPFWFHAVSLLFHLGTTTLAFLLARKITQNIRLSFICAILFGVHPIHVEAVAWVTGLIHLMYTFFYLSTVYIYCLALERPRHKIPLISLSFFTFCIAGCSFSGGVITLPAILLLIAGFKEQKFPKQQLIGLIPFFLLAAYFAYLTIYTARNADVITNTYFNTDQYSLLTRLNLSALSVARYIQQIIFPHSFTFEYPQGYFLPLSHPGITLSFAALVFLLILNHWRFFHLKYFTLGFFIFLITIAPFLKFYSTSTSITQDRYAYLASFGLLLILAECVDTLLARKRKQGLLIKILLAAGLLYLITTTWVTSQHWRNGETLWTQLIKIYPRAYPAYVGRADFYINARDYEKALADCDTALLFDPRFADALSLKGTALLQMQRFDQAIEVYSKLLELRPNDITALNNRGVVYLLLGQNELALPDFNRSLELDNKQSDSRYNRAVVYFQQRRYQEALTDLQEILKRNPRNAMAAEKIKEVEKKLLNPD